MQELSEFLYPRNPYHGQVKPGNLVFDANLQEFSKKVSIVSALESGGKVSPLEAYEQISGLWEQLKRSKKHLLGDDINPSSAA